MGSTVLICLSQISFIQRRRKGPTNSGTLLRLHPRTILTKEKKSISLRFSISLYFLRYILGLSVLKPQQPARFYTSNTPKAMISVIGPQTLFGRLLSIKPDFCICFLSNLMLCKMFDFHKSLKTMQKSLELLMFLIRDILLHLIQQHNVTGKSCQKL